MYSIFNIVFFLNVGLSLKPCLGIDSVPHLTDSNIPDHVQKYCRDIKKRYVQQPVLPESDWPPTLGGQFIRLALIKQGRDTGDFKHRIVVELQEDYVRGKYDKILEHKTEIRLEEIFEPVFCKGGYEVTLKMLIDGAPGVGKTTLSRKVSQTWANGELLQEYWLVLLLHLRERTISKAQVIDDFFYHDDQMVQNATIAFIKETSGRGVLIIFDGFDELSLTQRQEQSLFLDIIKGKVLSECAVIVTSRPYASRPVQELQSVNRHIEVLGFTNEQIEKCIKQSINDEAKAEELCTELKDRLDIASICQIPLNCSIVLYVYKMEDYRLPDTLTELYELFILHGLRRYATRKNVTDTLHDIYKLPSPIQNHFGVLSRVAYDGLTEDKLVFEQWDLEQEFSGSQGFSCTDLPLLDLMTSAKSYSSRGPHNTYSFLHLTIQEYLSAFWAAKNLSEDEKIKFLRDNYKNERFYMVLWFFAGITKLNISNVHSVFSTDLWEYDNHVHICHLFYEADPKGHYLCSYVAKNCTSSKAREFSFVGKDGCVSRHATYKYSRSNREYSRFDTLMISHFLAHSNCQWSHLILSLDDVELFHKVFNHLSSCHTTIQQLTLEVDKHNASNFNEEVTSLLDEIPQVRSVRVQVVFPSLSSADTAVQTVKSNFKNILTKSKIIKGIYMDFFGTRAVALTRPLYDVLVEGIAHNNSLVADLGLMGVTSHNFEYLISLLTNWNSSLKLMSLTVSNDNSPHCREEGMCRRFCSLLSAFLSNNTSLRQVKMLVPFDGKDLVNCVDAIQSGLDQNSTLETLIIGRQGIKFRRNKHTSKLELVKSYAKQEQDDARTQSRIQSRDSKSPCMEGEVDLVQASPTKQQKLQNSSEENPYQNLIHGVHVESQVHPHAPRPHDHQYPGTSSNDHLPTILTHPPLSAPMCFSHGASVIPQMQPNYYVPGSSSIHDGTHHLQSRNYQTRPQAQNDHQYPTNSTWTHLSQGLGSTNPMRWMPPAMMQNQPCAMPYQQQSHAFFPQYHVNPSLNYQLPLPYYYYPHIHAGMHPPHSLLPTISPYSLQTFTMPPRFPPAAYHHFTSSDPVQPCPVTAPPIQTIYNPNTGTSLPAGVGHHSPPLPTCTTSTS